MKLDFVLIYLNITRETSFLLNHIGVLHIDNHLIFLTFLRFYK